MTKQGTELGALEEGGVEVVLLVEDDTIVELAEVGGGMAVMLGPSDDEVG